MDSYTLELVATLYLWGYTYVKLDANRELLDTMAVAGLVGPKICSTEQTKLIAKCAKYGVPTSRVVVLHQEREVSIPPFLLPLKSY